MLQRSYIFPHAQQVSLQIHDALAALYEKALSVGNMTPSAVFLASSQTAVAQYRKLWAGEAFSFGLEITTLSAWVGNRWELYGDGSRIVLPIERKLLLHHVLSEMKEKTRFEVLASTPGTVSLLAEMAAEALPLLIDETFEQEPTETESFASLTKIERELVAVLSSYAQLLTERGLCEQSQAMASLIHIPWPLPVLFVELSGKESHLETCFFEALGCRTELSLYPDERSSPVQTEGRAAELEKLQRRLFNPNPVDPVKPTGSVSFLLPAGHYAEALLIAQSIVEYACEGNQSIALAAKRPFDMFERLAPYLVDQGIDVTVSGQSTLAETDFGKMWLTLLRFLYEDGYSTFQLSDVALSPFSDIPREKAYGLDSKWRRDRTCTKEHCLADLAASSDLFSRVLSFLETEEYGQALNAIDAAVRVKYSWSEAYKMQQLAAIDRVQSCLFGAQGLGIEVFDVLHYLEEIAIPSSAKTFDKPSSLHCTLDVMSLDALAEQAPCSYDMVIIADLDTVSYAVRDDSNAKDRLFEKLGISSKKDVLERVRRCFFKALSVPVKHLVCERVLNTLDAQPAYPAIMLEELLDCYRSDLLSSAEDDRSLGIPKKLVPYVRLWGEDRLYQNLAVRSSDQPIRSYEKIPAQGKVSDAARAKIVPSSSLFDPSKLSTPTSTLALEPLGKKEEQSFLSLSPSAIENYLECPYKWFSLRRLRLEEPDAGFGPLEMGSFAHRLLKNFYQVFQKRGSPKVTHENIDDAKALLSELFDKHVDFQKNLKYRDNPLIALTALEVAEVASLKKRLISYLDREVKLLPSFTPRYFEYSFGSESSLAYANNLLHGTIDRIDVNSKGQAVVIDYKGSVSREYAYGESSEVPWANSCDSEKILALPYKVQTLLYAQAARRELGLDVVAALYVSYGRDANIAGTFDHRVLGVQDLPGIDVEACRVCGGAASVAADMKSASSITASSSAVLAVADSNPLEFSDFAALLDYTEEVIGCALAQLREGYIEPYPRGKNPCGYCPVTACEFRRML